MNNNQLRENNPNWKGGKVIDNGYVRIYIGNGKYKAEHKIVMEKKLKRKLTPNEIVHHIDEKFEARKNNNLSNLQLTDRSKHISHHKKGSGRGYWVTFYQDRQRWGLQIRNKDGKWKSSGNYNTREEALKIVEQVYKLKVTDEYKTGLKNYKDYRVNKENKNVDK